MIRATKVEQVDGEWLETGQALWTLAVDPETGVPIPELTSTHPDCPWSNDGA